jgi:hypothetical protein
LKASGIRHESVSHGQGNYMRGEVHTNNIESFWSLLKRGIMGSTMSANSICRCISPSSLSAITTERILTSSAWL